MLSSVLAGGEAELLRSRLGNIFSVAAMLCDAAVNQLLNLRGVHSKHSIASCRIASALPGFCK
jgi:hypothetical protein